MRVVNNEGPVYRKNRKCRLPWYVLDEIFNNTDYELVYDRNSDFGRTVSSRNVSVLYQAIFHSITAEVSVFRSKFRFFRSYTLKYKMFRKRRLKRCLTANDAMSVYQRHLTFGDWHRSVVNHFWLFWRTAALYKNRSRKSMSNKKWILQSGSTKNILFFPGFPCKLLTDRGSTNPKSAIRIILILPHRYMCKA